MALWFATRAFGIVSLTLFSTVMVLGLLTAGRRPLLRTGFVVTGLHRSLALLALVFLGLHIAANVLDSYVTIHLQDAVVPFISPYHPVWLGLGAIACDIILTLIITSLLRVRIGLPVWRAIHWLAYACWPIAIAHGIGVGTDRRVTIAVAAVCAVAVASAAALRIAAAGRRGAGRPPAVATRAGRHSAAGRSAAAVRPTAVRPTAVRPTAVRPTAVRPTGVRPTAAGPSPVPGQAAPGFPRDRSHDHAGMRGATSEGPPGMRGSR